MKKRIVGMLLAVCMLTLCACSNGKPGTSSDTSGGQRNTAPKTQSEQATPSGDLTDPPTPSQGGSTEKPDTGSKPNTTEKPGTTAKPNPTEKPGTTAKPPQSGTDPKPGETDQPPQGGGDLPDTPDRLELKYDDRYTFPEGISKIQSQSVTSKSPLTGKADDAVLALTQKNGNTVVACGTGSAEVVLKNGKTVAVTVTPAPISLLFLFGQSNAEGMILGNNPEACAAARSQSVVCEEGQIYSTYAPYNAGHGQNIGGAPFTAGLSVNNASGYVAASLTSAVNGKGAKLEYPLNSLSANGGGKSGMDSSIAYEWNRLTGEKVWVVNASHSGSSISTWQPGNSKTDNDFWQAVGVATTCEQVLAAEIKAGHYTFSQMGYFWLQGCADRTWTSKQYTDAYLAMHNGFKKELSLDLTGDGKNEEPSFGAIVLVRHPVTSLTPLDLELNGPRTAQIYMGTSTEKAYSDIYLASTLGDLWVGDANVENWFATNYPSGKPTYPTHAPYALPSTVSEVHPDIHYRQPGYNELGRNAVQNLLNLLSGKAGASAINVYRKDGYTVYKDQDRITLKAGESLNIAALAAPGSVQIKGLTVESNCKGLTVACNTLSAASTAAGNQGTLRLSVGGKLLLTLNVTITA